MRTIVLALSAAATLVGGALAADAPTYRHAGQNQAAIGVFCLDTTGESAACGDSVVRGAAAYRGAAVAANTSQQIMAANTVRRGFSVQNQTAGNCGVKIGGAAATLDQVSMRLTAGQMYETPPHHASTGAVAVICAQAGGIYATEF